jgi:hypothetical protein
MSLLLRCDEMQCFVQSAIADRRIHLAAEQGTLAYPAS